MQTVFALTTGQSLYGVVRVINYHAWDHEGERLDLGAYRRRRRHRSRRLREGDDLRAYPPIRQGLCGRHNIIRNTDCLNMAMCRKA